MMKPLFPLCILLLFISCKNKQEKISPAEERISESVYASGTIKSFGQYEVYATTNGILKKLLVDEGSLVKKGDPLFVLDARAAEINEQNATLSAAYSAVEQNAEKLNELKIASDLAETKLKTDSSLVFRQRALWAQQIGTLNDLDQRELTYASDINAWESAKLKYKEMQKQINFQSDQAKKNLQLTKTLAGDYVIKSEVNGKVYRIFKEKGELINPQTAIALIGDSGKFILELQVDEYDIARIRPGQKIAIAMDSYKGEIYEAAVEKINPMMDERTRSFTVDAVFIKQPPALFANLSCEANILIREKAGALTIPAGYLLPGDSVILENKEHRKITTGIKDYQKVEVLGGISLHDVLLKPGQ